MMNRGNSRQRAYGRMLARGRVARGSQLDDMISTLDGIISKEGGEGGAGSPITGDMVHTPTPGSSRKVSRKSRLKYSNS